MRQAPAGGPRRPGAQALVETALVFPLLVTLSLGVLQLALYYHARDVLTGAAQEGARLAAEEGRTTDDGVERARELVAAGLGATVDPVEPSGQEDDDVVAIQVDTRLRPIIPLPLDAWLPVGARALVAREHFRPDRGGP